MTETGAIFTMLRNSRRRESHICYVSMSYYLVGEQEPSPSRDVHTVHSDKNTTIPIVKCTLYALARFIIAKVKRWDSQYDHYTMYT